MTSDIPSKEPLFVIVRNAEEQWSIWPAARALPAGWESVESADTKDNCLTRIEALWQDLTPKSLRATVSP